MTTPNLPPLPEWDAVQHIDRDARTAIQEFVYCNEPSDIVPGSEAQFRDQLQAALQEAYQAGRDAPLDE